MKKHKINLIYTKKNLDSDCKQSSLLQVAVKTLKIYLVLQVNSYVPDLHESIILCLSSVFFNDSEQDILKIKALDDDNKIAKNGLYS